MGFITSTMSVKKLATNLRRKKGLDEHSLRSIPREYVENVVSPDSLDPYIYERLYLPIVVDGVIPLKNLDFDLITHEDVELLDEVLSSGHIPVYINLGVCLTRLSASATDKQIFI